MTVHNCSKQYNAWHTSQLNRKTNRSLAAVVVRVPWITSERRYPPNVWLNTFPISDFLMMLGNSEGNKFHNARASDRQQGVQIRRYCSHNLPIQPLASCLINAQPLTAHRCAAAQGHHDLTDDWSLPSAHFVQLTD